MKRNVLNNPIYIISAYSFPRRGACKSGSLLSGFLSHLFSDKEGRIMK